jgi:hypothetical protein
MPDFSIVIGPLGALILVHIGVTAPRRQALLAANEPVPEAVLATLLIDTGASISGIDAGVLKGLPLQPTGVIGLLTPTTGATPQQTPTYDVELTIPGGSDGLTYHIAALAVTEGHFSGHQGLLGRDVLQACRMTYNGLDNTVQLSF